jgi:hypothetical protein
MTQDARGVARTTISTVLVVLEKGELAVVPVSLSLRRTTEFACPPLGIPTLELVLFDTAHRLNNHAQAHHILQTQLSASKSRCEKILYGNLPSTSSSSSVAASTNPTPTVSSLSTSSRSPASNQASTSTLTSTLRPSHPYARLSGFLSPPPFSPPRPVSINPSSEPNSTPSGLIHHRTLSSTNSRLSSQCRDLEAELDRVRSRNGGKQESLRERRARVARRRANLRKSQEEEEKDPVPSQPQAIHSRYELESALIASLRTRLVAQRRQDQLVQAEIRAARKVLVKEVVDVFGVRPCRPLNGNGVEDVDGPRVGKGDGVDLGREEWDMEITGLRFPSPGGFTGKLVLLSSLSVSKDHRMAL